MGNQAIQKYLRQIKRIYRGDRDVKEQFIRDMEDALCCYLEKHPECSYKDLTENFGTPDEIKESFSDIVPDRLKKRNLFVYRTIILGCSLLVILGGIVTTVHVVESYQYSKGHYEEYMYDSDKSDPLEKSPLPTPIAEYHFD